MLVDSGYKQRPYLIYQSNEKSLILRVLCVRGCCCFFLLVSVCAVDRNSLFLIFYFCCPFFCSLLILSVSWLCFLQLQSVLIFRLFGCNSQGLVGGWYSS